VNKEIVLLNGFAPRQSWQRREISLKSLCEIAPLRDATRTIIMNFQISARERA